MDVRLSVMTVQAIKEQLLRLEEEVRRLTADERHELFALLDRERWDAEIEHDFSPGGMGMSLLDSVDAQIEQGEFEPFPERARGA